MKKTLFSTLMLLASGAYANDCIVELQFEGSVLGQNSFMAQSCLDATRECKRTQKRYEMRYGFNSDELSCVRLNGSSIGNGGYNPQNPNPGNGGYNPNPNSGNGGYNPNSNPGYDPTYSRTQALLDLERLEGSSSQADEVFELITAYVSDLQIGLRNGVELFTELTRIHGGNGSTTFTKSVFEVMVAEANSNQIDVFELTKKYEDLVVTEGSKEQAIENLQVIARLSLENNVELIRAIDGFNVVLNTIGNGNTSSARTIYASLISVRRVMLEIIIEDYIEMYRIEGDMNAAIGNIELILEAAAIPSVRYREAKQSMIDLFATYGSGNTSTVRSKFRRIYGL